MIKGDSMRILMINKFLFPNGGSETYIMKLGEYLQFQGHEVQYFGMTDERNVVGNQIGAYTSNMDFHTGKIKKLLYPIKVIYSKDARKQIRKVINNFKPDVCHLNNISFQITPSIIYEIKKHDIPIIWTLHDLQLICPDHLMFDYKAMRPCEKCLGQKYSNCYRNKCIHNSKIKSLLGTIEAYVYKCLKTYKKVDLFIAPSYFLRDKYLTNPIFQNKIVVLHNFIEPIICENIKKKDYVIYFGRYSEEKGMQTLISAVQQLPDIPFIFAGSGPYLNKIRELSNVEEVGFQTGDALRGLISKARFSVCTSECYENCPLSVMESQMYGTPVIGARIGGIPELIDENITGILYQSGSVNDLIAKIENLWEDKVMCQKLTENCKHKQFISLYDYSSIITEIYCGNHYIESAVNSTSSMR